MTKIEWLELAKNNLGDAIAEEYADRIQNVIKILNEVIFLIKSEEATAK